MKQRLVYFGGRNVQFLNSGDILLNRILFSIVSGKGRLIVEDRLFPVRLQPLLFEYLENIQLLSEVTRFNFFTHLIFYTIKNIIYRKFDLYVLEPPGHFFTSQAKPLWRDWSILITYRFLSLLGCKRVVLGLTLGPFEDAYAKFLGKTSGSYFQIGLRDRESLNLAEKYSFSNTTYIPDLAWYSQEEYAKMSQSLYVLLSFRDSVTGTRRDMPYFNALTDALDKVLPDLGKKILLFYQTVYDRNACLDIFDRYQDKHDIEFIDKCLSHTEASILYSGAELVISNRMHVLVPALKANTLIFSITDTQRHCKLRSVLYENDIPECFGDLSDQELREKLRLLQEDRENFLAKVKRIIAGNTAEINSIMNLIWP